MQEPQHRGVLDTHPVWGFPNPHSVVGKGNTLPSPAGMICRRKVSEVPSQPPEASSPARWRRRARAGWHTGSVFTSTAPGLGFLSLYLNDVRPSGAAEERAPEQTPSFTYLFPILSKDTRCFAALASCPPAPAHGGVIYFLSLEETVSALPSATVSGTGFKQMQR